MGGSWLGRPPPKFLCSHLLWFPPGLRFPRQLSADLRCPRRPAPGGPSGHCGEAAACPRAPGGAPGARVRPRVRGGGGVCRSRQLLMRRRSTRVLGNETGSWIHRQKVGAKGHRAKLYFVSKSSLLGAQLEKSPRAAFSKPRDSIPPSPPSPHPRHSKWTESWQGHLNIFLLLLGRFFLPCATSLSYFRILKSSFIFFPPGTRNRCPRL